MKNMDMMGMMLGDDELDAVAGGAGNGAKPKAKFSVGDWVCYAWNPDFVGKITSVTYDEGGYWKYGVKINGEGEELRWVGEELLKKK